MDEQQTRLPLELPARRATEDGEDQDMPKTPKLWPTPGSKSEFILTHPLTMQAAEVAKLAIGAGFKGTTEQQVHSTRYYKKIHTRKVAKHARTSPGTAAAPAAAAPAEATEGAAIAPRRGGRRARPALDSATLAEALREDERDLLRLAMDIGFKRAAAILHLFREKLGGLIDQ